MTDLITRLRNAETGSRELDALVAAAVGWKPHIPRWWRSKLHAEYRQSSVNPGTFELFLRGQLAGKEKHVPKWSTSLDALVTLKEERLPGWRKQITNPVVTEEGSVCRAVLSVPIGTTFNPHTKRHFISDHKSEPLAFLIAILKALEIEE